MGSSARAVFTTVRSPSVTLPLVGHEVGEVVLEEHAGGRGVAPVVHLAAPEDSQNRNITRRTLTKQCVVYIMVYYFSL